MELIKTQKQLKRALFSRKEKLSPKEIFLSLAYKEFLTQMTKGFVSDFAGSSNIYEGAEEVAYTEGLNIFINYNSELARTLSVSDKNKLFKGLNLHELGHLLLTDFKLQRAIAGEMFSEKKIYPVFDFEYKEELEDFIQVNPSAVINIYHAIENSLEDGYVDRVMMAKTPGYGPYLRYVREIDHNFSLSYKEQKASGLKPSMIFFNLILEYARFGTRTYDETDTSDELIIVFKECEEIIEKAVFDTFPRNRAQAAWKILAKLYHLLKEDIDKKDPKGSEGESGDGSDGSSDEKGSSEGKDEKDPTKDSESKKSGGKKDSDESPSDKISPSLESAMDELSKAAPKERTERKGDEISSPSKEAMDIASKLLEKEKSDMYAPAKESDASGSDAKELEKLKDDVAKEKVSEDQEKAIADSLSKDKEKDSHGIHENVTCKIVRSSKDAEGERLYEQEHSRLDKVVKRFIRDFLKEIEDRQIGSTQKGLYFGKGLTIDQVYRKDKKIFNNKIAPEDIPNMGVGILVDLSGSMYGPKMDRARESAYITYQFCQELNIPCFVIGHTVNFHTHKVEFHCVADENSLDKQDAKRIFSLRADGDNRDGFALRFCYRKLEAMEAETKLLLVISDGAPCDSSSRGVSYHMNNGAADMKMVVSEYLKKGIKTIVAGLGDDAPNIKRCYKEGLSDQNSAQFLDVTDIEKMPKAFIKILKRYLE